MPYEEQEDVRPPQAMDTIDQFPPASSTSGVQHSSPELDRTVDMSSMNQSRFYSPDPNETSVSFVRPPTRRLFSSSQNKPKSSLSQQSWLSQPSIEMLGNKTNLSLLSNLSEKEAVGWCFENVMEQIKAQSAIKLRKTAAPWMIREKENLSNFSSPAAVYKRQGRQQRSPLELRFMQALQTVQQL
jgi:hypothetical protein